MARKGMVAKAPAKQSIPPKQAKADGARKASPVAKKKAVSSRQRKGMGY